jgi:hypothetical protein
VFRQRFAASTPIGRLDWPPVLEIPGQVAVRIFDPADAPRRPDDDAGRTSEADADGLLGLR